MKRLIYAGAAALALGFCASGASAQSMETGFNVAVVSDYVFRGFSQSDEDPAVQAGVDVSYGGLYGGAWASTVEFGDSTDAEVDIYGGYRTSLAGFDFDLGGIAYLYVGAPSVADDYDYVEVKGAVSRSVGPVAIGAAVYWSPDFFGIDEEATWVEASLAVSPMSNVTVSGAYGEQSLDVNADYATWNIGVGYSFPSGLGLDVRYYDSDVAGPLSDDRVVGALKYSF